MITDSRGTIGMQLMDFSVPFLNLRFLENVKLSTAAQDQWVSYAS